MDIQSLAALADSDLLARAARLAHGERRATAALVAHLAEIETRKLYLGQACSSLFTYCIRVLRLSEPAAYNRIQAARAARRFPAVLVHLEQGRVHLASVKLLAPVLTMENHHELLAAAAHKSKREVEELVARLRPQPDVPGRIRKLPAMQKPAAVAGAGAGSTSPRAEVVPLAAERYKVQFTAGAATREKLRRAQELLRHRIPDGDVARVIDAALDLLVQQLEKKKFAGTERPRRGDAGLAGGRGAQPLATPTPLLPEAAPPLPSPSPSSSSSSRYISAGVRRAVWERDRGQCAFVSAGGERCTERARLEFDHIRPHADGGGAQAHNVRLLCRQHNQHEAQQFFGLWQADGDGGLAARSG